MGGRFKDVHAGCFSTLFGLRPRRDRSGTGPKSEHGAALRQTDFKSAQSELPPHVHLTHCWCGPTGDEQFFGMSLTEKPPAYEESLFRPEVVMTIEKTIEKLSPELRELSLDIWNHPELMWEENYAHAKLTAFMSARGFSVTPHYLGVATAFRAVYTHPSSNGKLRKGMRVIGVNSEMDALPGIGHGCGHNLIAMSGVAVSLSIKAALEAHDIAGTVVLLGTPAEESGGGKITLLERGAYDEMDACIMSHPTAGPDNFSAIWPGVACQPIEVEFFGHGAHAASAPWEAQNALDAAFIAYASISALRQQIKPDHRVHGIVLGRDWAPNVIPDYAKLRYIVRAPTWVELEALRARVKACFDAAALATACKIEVSLGEGYFELRNNDVLGQEYANVVGDRYQMNTVSSMDGAKFSTDFGNVTHALPALHPAYSIPTEPQGANHTPQFNKSASTQEAHDATLKVAVGLAATGVRVLADAQFADKVRGASPSLNAHDVTCRRSRSFLTMLRPSYPHENIITLRVKP
ncbi:amidohydrolase [Trametes gibbosa]|nr:amidohydrolase [Trametes gibbosa]